MVQHIVGSQTIILYWGNILYGKLTHSLSGKE